jgi:hypothetical protein
MPERALTLTLVAPQGDPNPWATAQRNIAVIRRNLGRLGVDPGEWVTHIEPNPKGTGFHAHIWQHGSRIPKQLLSEAADRAGTGWTRIERIRATASASRYGLKGLGYGLKGTTDSPAEYLRVNGGRLTHQSRGFFRGLPVREAERRAIEDRTGGDPQRWVIHWTTSTPALAAPTPALGLTARS